MTTQVISLKQQYHDLFAPPVGRVQEIVVPKFNFAMIDGAGVPETSEQFQHAIQTLYGVSYGLKFARKQAGLEPGYVVAPLEGLWWMASGHAFDLARPDDWRWTLMIMQPEFITRSEFDQAVTKLAIKKPELPLAGLRLEQLDEGRVVQTMHVGPYDAEGPNLQLLADYADAHGYDFAGRHHEIYLGDPRRAKPDKLRTILRRPVVLTEQ